MEKPVGSLPTGFLSLSEKLSEVLICRFCIDEKRNNTLSHLLCSRCEPVGKTLRVFPTKGLQSAARIICVPVAHKFHTCSLRSIFSHAHVSRGNDCNALPPAGGKLCEAFFACVIRSETDRTSNNPSPARSRGSDDPAPAAVPRSAAGRPARPWRRPPAWRGNDRPS